MKFHEVEYYKKMYDTKNFVIFKLTPSLVITPPPTTSSDDESFSQSRANKKKRYMKQKK